MSDFIKRQDVLMEIRAEIKQCEDMHVNVSEDSLIRIIEQAEGYNSNEHFARKIVKALEKEAQHSDKIVVGLGAVEDRMAQLKKSEAYRYAQEIVVNILDELKSSDEWFPCSEQLPNVSKCRVTVQYDMDDGKPVYDTMDADFSRFGTFGESYKFEDSWRNDITNNVIAWQPLPEPYKPE